MTKPLQIMLILLAISSLRCHALGAPSISLEPVDTLIYRQYIAGLHFKGNLVHGLCVDSNAVKAMNGNGVTIFAEDNGRCRFANFEPMKFDSGEVWASPGNNRDFFLSRCGSPVGFNIALGDVKRIEYYDEWLEPTSGATLVTNALVGAGAVIAACALIAGVTLAMGYVMFGGSGAFTP